MRRVVGVMKRPLAWFLNKANCILPAAKRLLPKPALRFILLHILDVNRAYNSFDKLPSRLFLERELLPWLRDRNARILFVGTASYTYHYERLFEDDPGQFVTIDSNPSVGVWGARKHIVAPIQAIGRHQPPQSFDCVVLNGVFGFGVDDIEDMRATVKAIHMVLRLGGLLVLGWNTNQHAPPNTLHVLEPFFLPNAQLPWGAERRFVSETHVYNFYSRQLGL
jgi:hypothetical protein